MNICGSGQNYREAVQDLSKVVPLFTEAMIEKGTFEDFLIEGFNTSSRKIISMCRIQIK